MEQLFASFREQLEAEQAARRTIKEIVNTLEDTNRAFGVELQRAHTNGIQCTPTDLGYYNHICFNDWLASELCAKVKDQFIPSLQFRIRELKTLMSKDTFWRYLSSVNIGSPSRLE